MSRPKKYDTSSSMTMARRFSDFERAVDEYSDLISAAVRRVCLKRYGSMIPDVTQEVHMAVWKILKTRRPLKDPPAYIYRVALTTGMKVVEREEKQASEARSVLEGSGAGGNDRRALDERADLLEELLAQLQPEETQALKAYLAGYNHVEIARLFQWTESAARDNVDRSIEKLREHMRDQNRANGIVVHE